LTIRCAGAARSGSMLAARTIMEMAAATLGSRRTSGALSSSNITGCSSPIWPSPQNMSRTARRIRPLQRSYPRRRRQWWL
jgi:hypothetical protein